MNTNANQPNPSRRTSPLVLCVVVAILAFVLGITVGGLGGWTLRLFSPFKAAEAATQLSAIRLGLEMFYADTGRFPTVAEGVGVLRDPVYRGPYIGEELALDPWERPFLYSYTGAGVPTVSTLGRDGAPGGTGEDMDLSTRPILKVASAAAASTA